MELALNLKIEGLYIYMIQTVSYDLDILDRRCKKIYTFLIFFDCILVSYKMNNFSAMKKMLPLN